MKYIVAPTEEYLEHSAKGTTWKKHKYIKKSNGRYYYADDVKRQRARVSANYKMRDSVKKAETDWENGKYFTKEPAGFLPVSFDKDAPGSLVDENIKRMKDGQWDGYANEDMRNAIWWNNEIKKIDEEQKYADANRSTADKLGLKALNATADAKSAISKKASKISESVSKAIDKVKDIKIDDIDDSITIFRGDDGKENFRVKYSAPTGNEKNNAKDLKKKTTKKSTTFFDDDDKERFKVKYHR